MKLFKLLSRKERGAKRERFEESVEDNVKRVKFLEDVSVSVSLLGEVYIFLGFVF